MTLSAGWYRARVRPWNDSVTAPMVRLDRGGGDFLASVTRHLNDIGETVVYSPALYPDSTNVWKRGGFRAHAQLELMEHGLGTRPDADQIIQVAPTGNPDWGAIHDLDSRSFQGFWTMSETGLREAFETNRTSSVLQTFADGTLAGYAIVGMQWGIAYLHRIAVSPEASGAGRGAALLTSALVWARAHGGRSMILNVRDDNERALRLYEREGFTRTGTALVVLRHEG
jgi:ribosomal-protein-alanine N-acetyltransferase